MGAAAARDTQPPPHQATLTHQNRNTGVPAAAVARDTTCLEPQVCFFIFHFLSHYNFFRYTSKR